MIQPRHINEHGNAQTKYDGKRAKVTGKDHPWRDTIAECLGAKVMGGKWFMIFRDIETDIEFGVDNGNDVKWID
jgi:hypothetical protein